MSDAEKISHAAESMRRFTEALRPRPGEREQRVREIGTRFAEAASRAGDAMRRLSEAWQRRS